MRTIEEQIKKLGQSYIEKMSLEYVGFVIPDAVSGDEALSNVLRGLWIAAVDGARIQKALEERMVELEGVVRGIKSHLKVIGGEIAPPVFEPEEDVPPTRQEVEVSAGPKARQGVAAVTEDSADSIPHMQMKGGGSPDAPQPKRKPRGPAKKRTRKVKK